MNFINLQDLHGRNRDLYGRTKKDYIKLRGLEQQIRDNDMIPADDYVVEGPMLVTPVLGQMSPVNQLTTDWRYVYNGDQVNKQGMNWAWIADNDTKPCYQQIIPLGNGMNGLNSTCSPSNNNQLLASPYNNQQLIASPRIVDMSYALEYEDLPPWRTTYRGGYISVAGYKYCWTPLNNERGMYMPC